MDRVEYRVEDNKYSNRIGVSVKRPKNLRRKWSEDDIRIKCSECDSKNISTGLSGDVLAIACLDCPNYERELIDRVLTWSRDEEAIATISSMKHFEEIKQRQS